MISQKLFQIRQYINYKFKSHHRKGHGVHSPYVFDFVQSILNTKHNKNSYQIIIDLKKDLCKDQNFFELQNIGAGSSSMKNKSQKIGTITTIAGIRNKYGKILFNLVNHYKPAKVLELGTSLGLGSIWLALANESTHVFTIEGQQSLMEKAKNNFQKLGLKNISTNSGTFDDNLDKLINEHEFNLVFIDGNHTYEATKRYFELLIEKVPNNALLIFDDIYWSKGMKKAWDEIKTDKRVIVSIDIFQFGIVLKNRKITPGKYRIRY